MRERKPQKLPVRISGSQSEFALPTVLIRWRLFSVIDTGNDR